MSGFLGQFAAVPLLASLLTAPVSVAHYLVVGAILFTAGVVCMAVKRNALGVLMGIELVLNGANVNFVAFASPYFFKKIVTDGVNPISVTDIGFIGNTGHGDITGLAFIPTPGVLALLGFGTLAAARRRR